MSQKLSVAWPEFFVVPDLNFWGTRPEFLDLWELKELLTKPQKKKFCIYPPRLSLLHSKIFCETFLAIR